MLLGEVAAPAGALAPLVSLALLVVAFGIVWSIRKLLNALFGWLIAILSHIPQIGGYLEGALHTAEQAVSNALGAAEHAIDAAIGASWHLLARYVEWLWREIRGNAVLALEIATGIYPVVVAVRWVKSHVLHLDAAHVVSSARTRTLEHEYHGIDVRVRKLERELHGIDQVKVTARLGKIEAEIGTIEAQTIPSIQQAESDAASAINNLYDWVKGKAALLGVGTFVTAIAGAFGLSSLAGFLCNEFRNILGRGCSGLWSGLDNLLGWLVDLFIITEICDVLPLLDAAVSDIATPLVVALTDVGAGLCDPASSAPATLTGPAVVFPSVYFDGTLVLA